MPCGRAYVPTLGSDGWSESPAGRVKVDGSLGQSIGQQDRQQPGITLDLIGEFCYDSAVLAVGVHRPGCPLARLASLACRQRRSYG